MFKTVQMDLVLREISQSYKYKYCFYLDEESKIAKLTEGGIK